MKDIFFKKDYEFMFLKNFFKKIVENSVSANDMMKWELLEK